LKNTQISPPLIIGVITVVVLIAGFLLYRGTSGGTVGTGEAGKVEAAPVIPGNKMPGAPPGYRGAPQGAPTTR